MTGDDAVEVSVHIAAQPETVFPYSLWMTARRPGGLGTWRPRRARGSAASPEHRDLRLYRWRPGGLSEGTAFLASPSAGWTADHRSSPISATIFR